MSVKNLDAGNADVTRGNSPETHQTHKIHPVAQESPVDFSAGLFCVLGVIPG